MRRRFLIKNNTSNISKLFFKNSFLIGLGTILGFANVSIASRSLGLTEYGNFLNFNISAQIIIGFSLLGLSELSVKYFYSNYGLNKYLNFVFIGIFQALLSCIFIVFYCLYTKTNFLLFLPFFLALVVNKFADIFLRASNKISLSNFASSIYFNLVILLTLLLSPISDYRVLIISFFSITFFILIVLTPKIYNSFRKKSIFLPFFDKKLIYENLGIGCLVILNGFFATIDQLIVSKVFGVENLALYKISLTIFLAGSFPHVVINTIAGPKISKLCFKKKFKNLLYFLNKISIIQIFLSFLAIFALFIIIQSSGDLIFNAESKPGVWVYFFMCIASASASVRGFSTIILIQNSKFREMFTGQSIYIGILMLSFYLIYSIFPQITSIYFSFAFAHIIFTIWILKKTYHALNQKINSQI